MIKRIFTWFFCNLYYFYNTVKKNQPKEITVTYVGFNILLPIFIFFAFLPYHPTVQGHKVFYILLFLFLFVFFGLVSYLLFYKSGLYIKLLKDYPENDFDPNIKLYMWLLCIVLPGLIMYFIFYFPK